MISALGWTGMTYQRSLPARVGLKRWNNFWVIPTRERLTGETKQPPEYTIEIGVTTINRLSVCLDKVEI